MLQPNGSASSPTADRDTATRVADEVLEEAAPGGDRRSPVARCTSRTFERARAVGSAFLLSSCLAAIACGQKDGAQRARPAPLVVVSKVRARDVDVEVRAPIDLRPFAQAEVSSKTYGYLDAVFVERGDKVKKGQVLAVVRPSDLPDQLAAARSTLAQSSASLALARANYERASKLAPNGIVSQQELQSATSSMATAKAAVSAARADAAALATRLGETRIKAPLDGVISVRRLDPGALVGLPAGGSIVTVVRTDFLRAFITVTERALHGVTVGKNAYVELDALPGKKFSGNVVRVAPTLDPQTRTLEAEMQIPNLDGELLPGMFGRGAIVVETHPHVPIVPAQAMQISNGKRYVFVVEGEKARRREITTGVDEGSWLEVTSGLREGEQIVTAGIDGLADNSAVRVTQAVDPLNGGQPLADTPSASLGSDKAATRRD